MSELALSIRQPWAWLILNAGKNIENRMWRTGFRGTVLIHASKGMTRTEYDDAVHYVDYNSIFYNGKPILIPAYGSLERGGIVGRVKITDCVTYHPSGWFVGDYGFVLKDPETLPFRPCRGQLNFFVPNYDQRSTQPA